MYGLQVVSTGLLLGLRTTAYDSEFGAGVEYELETDSENVWLVDRKKCAEDTLAGGQDYLGSHYEHPMLNYPQSDLRVVEVGLTIAFV